MKVFIWKRVEKCTDSFHEGGGVVVFASTEAEARALANAQPGCGIKDTEAPTDVRDCADGPARVYIMPDAGCC